MLRRSVEGMMLLVPYACGEDLYNNYFPVFYGPLRVLVAYKMEAREFAKTVECKPLVISSVDDDIVPYSCSKSLSNSYKNGSTFVTMEGFTHNHYWENVKVQENLADYLSEVPK